MIQTVGLNKSFRSGWTGGRRLQAVENVSLRIAKGGTLGLIGESGCGKSTVGRLLLKLLPADEGTVLFDGADITRYTMKQMRPLRQQMQLLFQHPDSALNPRRTLLDSLLEPMKLHRLLDKEARIAKVLELLELVGLQRDIVYRYPHQISGGQVQRVVIARALTLGPKLLVLDEPTSMLDVSVQAQVIELLQHVQRQFGMTYLFISHDLELVRHMCPQIAVMHKGRIVETGNAQQLMEQPAHAYTQHLVQAFRVVRPGRNKGKNGDDLMDPIYIDGKAMAASEYWTLAWERGASADARMGSDTEEEQYWREHASSYDERNPLAPYAGAIMEVVYAFLKPSDLLLEVGPGTGGFTRLLAPKVRQITVVEPSAAMYAELCRNWKELGFPAPAAVPAKWEEAPELRADILFSANAVYRIKDMKESLLRMNAAASRRVFLVQSMEKPFAHPLRADIGGSTVERERADALSGILHELGIAHEYRKFPVRRKSGVVHPVALLHWEPVRFDGH